MAHVAIRHRKHKGVWLCPEKVVDHFLANGWMKAAKDAEPADETPVLASRDSAES